MIPEQLKTRCRFRLVTALTCSAFLAGCATGPAPRPQDPAAIKILNEARSTQVAVERRAADYLQAAAITAPKLGSGTSQTPAVETYNTAAAELTILLRSGEGGRLWNHSLTLTNNTATYHLRLQPAEHAVWAPDYFTSFTLADSLKEKRVRKPNQAEGVGGELVGVRKLVPAEAFSPPLAGIVAPVTATLDFHGQDATLALRRPAMQPTAMVDGRVRPLAANYSAPLLYFKPVNETLVGLAGALFVSKYMNKTGLYFLQPYDPNRIPVVFVHGLISTPQMWLNVINEIQEDPVLRARYQFWIFGYPTGNPIAYSALRFREDLAKVDKLYPNHLGYVFVGHSLGGVLSQMQTTTITHALWEKTYPGPAKMLFGAQSTDSLISRAATFNANPRVKRVVFICTPHRGSNMATSTIGDIGMRLISIPSTILGTMAGQTSTALSEATGGKLKSLNVVSGLAPDNPMLKVLDKVPVQPPYHSIIGNQGKPGPLADSTDGVVPYWSSHMKNAQSELIVPGPHGSCELPQTIAELKRILLLHLKTEAR